jgi:hypothetical protein
MTILCQLGKPLAAKPQTIQEYGKLRDVMIQSPWVALDEDNFIDLVTNKGTPFYGCLFNGHDLLTEADGHQKNCWRQQTMVALDFDKCPIGPPTMSEHFAGRGYEPWFAYRTFSDSETDFHYSYRLVWRVEDNLNVSYDEVRSFIKEFAGQHAGGFADKHSMDASRLWQGSTKGVVYKGKNPVTLNLRGGAFNVHRAQ